MPPASGAVVVVDEGAELEAVVDVVLLVDEALVLDVDDGVLVEVDVDVVVLVVLVVVEVVCASAAPAVPRKKSPERSAAA